MLGFSDALVVSAPFGVFVADDTQKIQIAFLANCRDETSTRQRTQVFLIWLAQQKEDQRLAERARARRRIADAIAKEQIVAAAPLRSPPPDSSRGRRRT